MASVTQMSKATASTTPHCLQLSLNMDPHMTLTLSSSRISLLGQQTSEARVIRVSIDNNHGNLYRSILVRGWEGTALSLALGPCPLTTCPSSKSFNCVCVCVCVLTTWKNWFFPSTMWVPGIELGLLLGASFIC